MNKEEINFLMTAVRENPNQSFSVKGFGVGTDNLYTDMDTERGILKTSFDGVLEIELESESYLEIEINVMDSVDFVDYFIHRVEVNGLSIDHTDFETDLVKAIRGEISENAIYCKEVKEDIYKSRAMAVTTQDDDTEHTPEPSKEWLF